MKLLDFNSLQFQQEFCRLGCKMKIASRISLKSPAF